MSYLSYLIDIFQNLILILFCPHLNETNLNSFLSRKLIEQEIRQSLR